MSEAPKVIWASVQPTRDGWYQLVNVAGGQIAFPRTKYHHDDTVTALQAEVARQEAALREFPHHKKLSDHIRERTKALEETQ